MQIHNLKRTHKNKKDRLVGRGGKHAKTSGRGGKGQTARAGNKRRPELRDIIKKLPKNRGYQFKSVRKPFLLSRDKILTSAKLGVKGGMIETFSEIRKRLGIKGRKIRIK
jgi:ribosomal protein L15